MNLSVESRSSLRDAGSSGLYWSSVLSLDYDDGAWGLFFNTVDHGTSDYYRSYGQSIRPVQGFTK